MAEDGIKFEAAMTRLEEIVSVLEKGKCDLDDSLTLFEEGVNLVKICTSKLDAAAQKVKILTDGEGSDPDPAADGRYDD